MARLWIGISGWSYSNWRGAWYPATLPSRRYLAFYAQHFPTTELNSSFYHFPRPQTYQRWAEQVPAEFLFAVKANRRLTHSRQGQEIEETWQRVLHPAQTLGSHLGPILFQFPPSFSCDVPWLTALLQLARRSAAELRLVCEFRHASWFTEDVYRVLRRSGVALCIADSARYPRCEVRTTDFLYYRLHGRPTLFSSSYSEAALAQEARAMTFQLHEGLDVYVYFNNTRHGHAIANARRLLALVTGTATARRQRPVQQGTTRKEAQQSPRQAIRRFDLVAEWHRLMARTRQRLAEGDAQAYGLAVAKIVAARKCVGYSPEQVQDWQRRAQREDFTEAWWTRLGSATEFEEKIVARMGQTFYRRVFQPAVRRAWNNGQRYEQIRDALRAPWNAVLTRDTPE